MAVTRHSVFVLAGLVLFVVAALCAWSVIDGVTLSTVLGLVAAGLACWIAAALPQMRRRGLSRERLAVVRLYTGRGGLDVTLLWITWATEHARNMPRRTLAEREARAYALLETMRSVPRPHAQPATPSRV